MRRVQSYSGTEEGRGGMAEGGSWNQEQGQGQGSAFTPDDVTTAPRSASMHPVPSYGVVPTTEGSGARSDAALISPTIFAVFGKDSRKSMEGSTTTSASTSGLVGPSIPFALRRASSDCQFTSTGSLSRGGVEHEGKQPWAKAGIFGGGFSSTTENSGSSTTGWSDSPTTTATSGGFGKQPSTPPKETANPVAVPTAIDVSNMSFNPGSPSNTNGQGSSTMMSTTPVRSSLGMGLRARANSGTRLRGSGAAFGNQTRHPPLPPSLRATLAADKDLPSSEIRSEALLQRVIFSNPDSLPMTPRPSRRHQQQIYSQFGTTVAAGGAAGNGTANGGLFGGNLNNSIYSGNGYAGRTTARPPRFLDSAASTIDSDDEDEMEDSSDEEAQFAVDDIMDLGGTGTGTGTGMGTGAGSRSGSGSGSASGSVMLGVAAASGATTSAGTEGGMEVDAPMTTSSNAPMGTGQGKLSNRTSMGSLRGFAGVDSEDSAGSGQASNKNMTAWRESPSSTSNRAQKRKVVLNSSWGVGPADSHLAE
ncbi:hypothetical protein QFC19_008848 [Naganishia cerealis]|uniref:Uncharacterized protein n=1 Tax=Naganishia cerealis TaxID=610337 RepID=A0ACC2UYQ6_9TREE|nr:hypothetical protein QFC19_008848 [Naganishia cerealis]